MGRSFSLIALNSSSCRLLLPRGLLPLNRGIRTGEFIDRVVVGIYDSDDFVGTKTFCLCKGAPKQSGCPSKNDFQDCDAGERNRLFEEPVMKVPIDLPRGRLGADLQSSKT